MADEHISVGGSHAEQVTLTVAEVQNTPAGEDPPPTPESLGVSQHQFDKYFNAEKGYDWQSHARELEWKAKQNGDPAPAAEPTPEPTPEAPAAPVTEDEARTITANAGLDWDALNQKIGTQRDLDPADYEAIEKLGIPKAMIKDYVNSVNYQAELHFEKVQNAFGGKEAFESMLTWAQGTFTDAELQTLTDQVARPETMDMTINMLKAQYAAATGTENLVSSPTGITAPTQDTTGFASEAEMLQAMRDPRYRRDPAYRSSVEAKVAASTWGRNPRGHSL